MEELSRSVSVENDLHPDSFTALLDLPPDRAVHLLGPTALPLNCCEPPEPTTSQLNYNGSHQTGQLPVQNKRKEPTEKQVSNKNKNKKKKKTKGGEKGSLEEAEKLPYFHVRARRGQATDSHSLAERARREKINARMKLLQELVPGCNKISGTALVLDEIINHVQCLQQQVEFLSLRLAAVNQRIDFNVDGMFAAENEFPVESTFSSVIMPVMWPEVQFNGNRPLYQQWPFDSLHQQLWAREDNPNFITPENSLLSYDSSGNSASLQSNQVKMEL